MARQGAPKHKRVRKRAKRMSENGQLIKVAPGAEAAYCAEIERGLYEVKKVIVGQESMLERVMVGLVAGGHVLLEGVPGLAKTLAVKTLARVLDVSFRRIQFTPDLVPADLVGTRVYQPQSGEFVTELGPVFANLVLADEVNRAPAKVQSALLEVMQEHQVTIGGRSHTVPEPFLVLATQNPIESEGTYPLPEAQVDRFMFKVAVDYPSRDEELSILARGTESEPEVNPVLNGAVLAELQRRAYDVFVDAQVQNYALALIRCTRPGDEAPSEVRELVSFGASPRAGVHLLRAARGLALLRGRGYVLPTDVRDLAHDVLRHRLVLSYEALGRGIPSDEIIDRVLAHVRPPHADLINLPAAAPAAA